jgi:hypothetical protein
MLVLDRSYSMDLAGASTCGQLRDAAKTFTGQFAEGRDHIGLISFGADALVQQAPTTSFQTQLGYIDSSGTNHAGSGSAALDAINCNGNTNSSQAISLAYNELWKQNLPGALNAIVFETDGIPNTATMNFWDSVHTVPGVVNGSSCTDKNAKTVASGGFASAAVLPNGGAHPLWTTQVPLCGLGGGPACGSNNSYLSGNPSLTPGGTGGEGYTAGIVGAVGSTDTGDPGTPPNDFIILQQPYTGVQPPDGNSNGFSTSFSSASGCNFTSNNYPATAADFAWFPATDVYGNSLNPASNPYKTITMTGDGFHVANTGWTNWHNAASNAADSAAYNARVGVPFPAPNASSNLTATIYVIGLRWHANHAA